MWHLSPFSPNMERVRWWMTKQGTRVYEATYIGLIDRTVNNMGIEGFAIIYQGLYPPSG
jgi:hypothetical protein